MHNYSQLCEEILNALGVRGGFRKEVLERAAEIYRELIRYPFPDEIRLIVAIYSACDEKGFLVSSYGKFLRETSKCLEEMGVLRRRSIKGKVRRLLKDARRNGIISRHSPIPYARVRLACDELGLEEEIAKRACDILDRIEEPYCKISTGVIAAIYQAAKEAGENVPIEWIARALGVKAPSRQKLEGLVRR